mgnify:CR=1 FL=1
MPSSARSSVDESLQNKRMCQRSIQKLVKKYALNVTPLKHITPHKLRSTYGTNLYRETQDIYLVADVLGHNDVNTTKKHYAAITEDRRRNARNIVKLREDDINNNKTSSHNLLFSNNNLQKTLSARDNYVSIKFQQHI